MKPIAGATQFSPTVLALSALAHLALLASLKFLQTAPIPIPSTALIVDVIQTNTSEQKSPDILSQPKIAPPKPKSISRREHPQLTTELATETPLLATENPAPAIEATEATSPPSLTPIPKQPATPTAASQTAPRFDADYLENPVPIYPPLSRRAREEGKVVLHVLVEPSGLPSRVEIHTSSSFERLDKSAVTAVARWRFTPARQGNDAVSAWVLVPIVFSLKG